MQNLHFVFYSIWELKHNDLRHTFCKYIIYSTFHFNCALIYLELGSITKSSYPMFFVVFIDKTIFLFSFCNFCEMYEAHNNFWRISVSCHKHYITSFANDRLLSSLEHGPASWSTPAFNTSTSCLLPCFSKVVRAVVFVRIVVFNCPVMGSWQR